MGTDKKWTRAWPCGLILLLGVGLSGCSGLPSWADGRGADPPDAGQGAVNIPDISQLPTPPGPPPSAEQRNATVQTLKAARSQNQQAGENLDSQIENDFEFPTSSTN